MLTFLKKNSLSSSLCWQGLDRLGARIFSFAITIILARILSPRDFGVVAVLGIFIAVSESFVNGGFCVALIQKKEVDDVAFSSVFFLNIALALLLYGILFTTAPLISDYFGKEEICSSLRVLSLTLIIHSLFMVHSALLQKRMMFQQAFKISWVSVIVSGFIGIYTAWRGYGVWALVFQQLVAAIVSCCMYWFCIKWHPVFIFSMDKIKGLFAFGWKILLSALLEKIFGFLYESLLI